MHQVAEYLLAGLQGMTDSTPDSLAAMLGRPCTDDEWIATVNAKANSAMRAVVQVGVVIDYMLLELRQAGIDIDPTLSLTLFGGPEE